MARTTGAIIKQRPPGAWQDAGRVTNQPSAPMTQSKPMPDSPRPARSPSLDDGNISGQGPSIGDLGQRPNPAVGSHKKFIIDPGFSGLS